jgi:PQQ-dependent catabolism-associated beta-propeller protein
MSRSPSPSRAAGARLLTALAGLVLAAQALAQGVVYVSSEKDNALAIVDLATLSVTGSLPTCKRPRHLQRTPDGKRLLVACGESHQADIIDLATRRSVGKLALGDDPEAFDLSPDGKTIYVSNEDEGVLSFIDIASGKLLKSVTVGKEPEGVKVSHDGKTVWVTSEAASLVHVIDTGTAKLVKSVPVGKRPRRFALTPDGQQLWVTNELGASVTILSTTDYQTLATLEFEVKGARAADITPVGITMTRDGKRAFVALGRANRVAFVDVASRRVTDLVLVGKRAWNVALDQAEGRLIVVNGLSDDITVIDVAAAKAIKSIPVGRVPYAALVVE